MAGCERYEELICALAGGDLAPDREAELRAHMAGCEDCRRLYEAVMAASQVLREDMAEPPAALAEGVMARVAAYEAERAEARPVRPVKKLRRWMPLAAAACLAVVIAGAALPRLMGRKGASGAAADAAAPEAAPYVMESDGGEAAARSADMPETVSLTEGMMDAVAEEPAEAEEDFASDEDGALSGAANAEAAPVEPAAGAVGYTLCDPDGNAVAVISDREALDGLLRGEVIAAGPEGFAPMYTLTLDGVRYVLAADGEDGLVWWTEADGTVTRSPAGLDGLQALLD